MEYNECIRNLLKLILLLQNNSTSFTCSTSDCCKPFLGPSLLFDCYNTRVITLYNKDGSLFYGTYFENNVSLSSPYFRIQDIKDNCCTLLILNRTDDGFISTRQTISINISCICAIKCIEDINLSI